MDFMTLPTAIAFVGSLAVLCLTLIKLMTHRGRKTESEKIDELQNGARTQGEKIAVLDTKVDNNTDEIAKLHQKVDKLSDLILKLLSDNSSHG